MKHAESLRPIYGRGVRVDVARVGSKKDRAQQRKREHAKATRAGMARARAEGAAIGRPRASLNKGRVRGLLAGLCAAYGRGEGLRRAAKELGVSVSTLRRVSKGV